MVYMIDDFKIGHGPGILSSYFAVKGYKLLPLFEPSFGDEVNGHSFHNGRVVVVFSEKLGELGFFVIEDLFRSEFGCLDCDKSL